MSIWKNHSTSQLLKALQNALNTAAELQQEIARRTNVLPSSYRIPSEESAQLERESKENAQ